MTFEELKQLWKIEVFGFPQRKVNLRRLRKCLSEKELPHYLFWFRLSQYLYRKPRGLFNYRGMARKIYTKLLRVHGVDIKPETEIGANFQIAHRVGIVITGNARIGKNFLIRQNTTIGMQHPFDAGVIEIGDDVQIGANSCILGNNLRIGDGAIIGAMSFVNKDIPAGATVYSTHTLNIRNA